MLFVFKYKSLPIGLNIAGFQDLIPVFATLSKKERFGATRKFAHASSTLVKRTLLTQWHICISSTTHIIYSAKPL